MIEKLRKIRDAKGVFTAVLTDVSKTLDGIPQQLLIANLSAYCPEVWMIYNRKLIKKINKIHERI